MNDEELSRRLQRIVPPGPEPDARERAKLRALAAFRQGDDEPHPVRFRWPAWSFAAGAGMAAAVIMLALKWHAPSPSSSSSFLGDAALLTQMERTFPGELDAVIERDGQFKVALATQPSADSDQPLLVEFRRGPSVVRVLSFSGRRVCVDLDGTHACFEALIDGRGKVIVEGEDFVAQGSQSAAIHGWKIAAKSLSHSG